MSRIALNLAILALVIISAPVWAQDKSPDESQFSEQDKLRGSITPERAWWDLQEYHLSIEFMPESKQIRGSNVVTFKTLKEATKMQIDLQEPLNITKVTHAGNELTFERDGNVYWVNFPTAMPIDSEQSITIDYSGTPTESVRPPWQGGVTWTEDEKGQTFIATTCQGIGASIWWPCKDHGYDEPDRGVKVSVTVPEDLVAVSNGRLAKTDHDENAKKKTFHWSVSSPINNYCVNVNIGNYVSFSETFDGENGKLDVEYWVLKHQREQAEKQFKEAPRTLQAFEHWFGPYPFYEDSYKLVSVPYPGMEHQSSVTYGNGFKNGYGGRDLSGTGVGMKFDFIIVHESGHEWFGNNVSMKDAADMWIHEGFTNYSENLFVEYHFNEKEAQDYVIGCRRLVRNSSPIVGVYGYNNEGSSDMYYKGGNMLHSIRHIINDTEKWRSILRGLNEDFRRQTVDSAEIENYISQKSGIDFKLLFDQYLRGTEIPKLNLRVQGNTVTYHYSDVVDGFNYPLVLIVNGQRHRLNPTVEAQELTIDGDIETCELDRNFYVVPVKQ